MLVTPFSVVNSAEIATKTKYSIRRFKSTYGVSPNRVSIQANVHGHLQMSTQNVNENLKKQLSNGD